MVAKPIVGAHDCAGSNLYAHVLRGKLRRVVPRDNDAINESWISDRDRFSCHGIYSDDRLLAPRVKKNGAWVDVSWQEALETAAELLGEAAHAGGDSIGTLVSPSATLEEMYLLQSHHAPPRQRQHRHAAAPARLPRPGRRPGRCRRSAAASRTSTRAKACS